MMEKVVIISKSTRPDKKYQAKVNGKTVQFGAAGYQDYTTHKDSERRDRYIQRHKGKEDWSRQGIETSGFYAKHVLWNKPTIQASVQDLNNRYKDIKFRLKP